MCSLLFFFFSSRRRHTRFDCDWSSDVCSSDLTDWNDRPANYGDRDRDRDRYDYQGVRIVRAYYGWQGSTVNVTELLRARMRSEERRVGKECRSRWSP